MQSQSRILIFGASGAIGSEICKTFSTNNWNTVAVSRASANFTTEATSHLTFDPFASQAGPDVFDEHAPYNAVCWAQGSNVSDNICSVDIDEHLAIYQANCLYILATLKVLLNRHLLAPNAKLCIISSIWQNLARQDKLSYCMSKAALQGLVLSATADLAKDGIFINAILPGALDTPMTRKNVAPDQLEKLTNATYFNRLPALQDVANLAFFLCSPQNTGITGQFIGADLGFSHVRLL